MFFTRLHYGIFLVLTALITVGGGFNSDYDYYQNFDYHRPRDRQVALNLQAKAVKNQGWLIFSPRFMRPHLHFDE